MIATKARKESSDLARFVQSRNGGEIMEDGIRSTDFILRGHKNTAFNDLTASIITFYELRGYRQPDKNQLYFTKGHQRRNVYLTIRDWGAQFSLSNPD